MPRTVVFFNPPPISPISGAVPRIVSAIELQFTRLDVGVAALRKAHAKLKRYRAAVLKAAVGGKLTEAWRAEHPATEPASLLLDRILKEHRAKWEADLKAKGKDPEKVKYVEPEKPEMEDLPKLPEGWCWAKIAELFNVSYGLSESLSKTEADDEFDVPVIRIPNVTEFGSLDLSSLKYFPLSTDKKRSLLVHTGDVLFNWRNAPKWSGYFLTRVTNAVNQANFNASMTKEIMVPLPPLAEQHWISTEVERCLSIADEIEISIVANLKRAEHLRQSILKEAFAGRLVPQDPNDEPASVLLERIGKEREAWKKGPTSNGRYKKVSSEPVKIDVEGTRQVELWEGVES